MASIFTYESEPPSVSSPWPAARAKVANADSEEGRLLLAGMKVPLVMPLTDYGITKLEAEPQEGPTEYKLHLLLRPRRSFSATSTVQHVSGSYLSKSRAQPPIAEAEIKPTVTPILAPSSHSRQNRLQHLTTQLLWRLQQSSPYHSSSKSNLVLPILPETDVESSSAKGLGRLIPGLEGSSGALYEIGVSDDGTFVGLTREELEESLTVLRAMAFSLGCDLQILRVVVVGDCQWTEEAQPERKRASMQRKEKLLVAEVLVAPHLGPSKLSSDLVARPRDKMASTPVVNDASSHQTEEIESQSEQLRVSLTGSTTSGKSSLLGTLSTSTLDNGRGKSRLSLLKHRHEIVSGVTSSLAQELIGYQEVGLVTDTVTPNISVINYASGNISSWNDIHSASEKGRLVFVTDSAGHPRYRRTTVRGLMSWAPHWTLCCVAADGGEDSTGRVGATAPSSEVLGSAGLGVDLSKAHLDLCLKLNLPLVIVITKLDIASKVGLRNTLTKVLTTLKGAGRKPAILSSSSDQRSELQLIGKDEEHAAKRMIASTPPAELHLLVPIVLTSAVTGSGIDQLHALLKQLPANLGALAEYVPFAGQVVTHPQTLFHVDEVLTMPALPQSANVERSAPGFVLSGYLRSGVLEVGDKMLIGPCNLGVAAELIEKPDIHRARSYPGLVKGSPLLGTISHDQQRPSSGDFTGTKNDAKTTAPPGLQTWQEVRVNGLRNLRLPVRRLLADQVGTVAITFQDLRSCKSSSSLSATIAPLRRGMVMIPLPVNSTHGLCPAYSRFTAVFPQPSLPAWPTVLVTVYIASIRASAKIVEVKALGATPTDEDIFDFDNDNTDGSTAVYPSSGNQQTEITFDLVASQEWLEIGTQVLVTPGGGPSLTNQPEQRDPGSAGLDGYVGLITQAMV